MPRLQFVHGKAESKGFIFPYEYLDRPQFWDQITSEFQNWRQRFPDFEVHVFGEDKLNRTNLVVGQNKIDTFVPMLRKTILNTYTIDQLTEHDYRIFSEIGKMNGLPIIRNQWEEFEVGDLSDDPTPLTRDEAIEAHESLAPKLMAYTDYVIKRFIPELPNWVMKLNERL